MQVFKAARYFSPVTTSELKPTTSDLDILQSLSFLTSGDVTNLKADLPLYLAATEELSPTVDPTKWWERHREDLPHWASGFRKVVLLQPSSAADYANVLPFVCMCVYYFNSHPFSSQRNFDWMLDESYL